MEIVSVEEFFHRTMGGRPNRMDVSIYKGCEYECGCGRVHVFDPATITVLRELPKMRLVLACSEQENVVTCIKIKGWINFRFASLFAGSSNPDACR